MRKRLSEIGVRKAFGAPRRELMIQVLSENMLYSLLGGVLGLILSYGATFFLGSMLFSIDFMGNGVTDLPDGQYYELKLMISILERRKTFFCLRYGEETITATNR